MKTVAINLVTTFVLALILEAIFGFLMRHPRAIPSFARPFFRHHYLVNDREILQVSDCGKYDTSLFYILKPGVCFFQNREFKVELKINRMGLRDTEADLRNPGILALGDSHTAGWGVEQDDCFPQLLEGFTPYRVLNAGISSYGTAREMILSNRLSLDSVKFVVFQYHANDYDENLTFLKNSFSLPIRSENSYDSLKSVINQRKKYFFMEHLYGVSKAVALRIISLNRKNQRDVRDEAYSFLKIINHYPRIASKKIFVFKMDLFDYLNDDFVNAVDSIKSTDEFKNLDVETVRISGKLEKDDFFILDDHINKNGHRKIADLIRQQIFQDTTLHF